MAGGSLGNFLAMLRQKSLGLQQPQQFSKKTPLQYVQESDSIFGKGFGQPMMHRQQQFDNMGIGLPMITGQQQPGSSDWLQVLLKLLSQSGLKEV